MCSLECSFLRQSPFYNKVADVQTATLLKKEDCGTGIFLWILRNFQEHFLQKTCKQLLLYQSKPYQDNLEKLHLTVIQIKIPYLDPLNIFTNIGPNSLQKKYRGVFRVQSNSWMTKRFVKIVRKRLKAINSITTV